MSIDGGDVRGPWVALATGRGFGRRPPKKRTICLATAAILLTACASPSSSPPPSPVSGELLHWQADYCLFEAETDDIITAGPCLERESGKRFRSACSGKLHYKRALCERSVDAGYRPGTVDDCVGDPVFMGSTVRNGGA